MDHFYISALAWITSARFVMFMIKEKIWADEMLLVTVRIADLVEYISVVLFQNIRFMFFVFLRFFSVSVHFDRWSQSGVKPDVYQSVIKPDNES